LRFYHCRLLKLFFGRSSRSFTNFRLGILALIVRVGCYPSSLQPLPSLPYMNDRVILLVAGFNLWYSFLVLKYVVLVPAQKTCLRLFFSLHF
jgi:hypothetical protein